MKDTIVKLKKAIQEKRPDLLEQIINSNVTDQQLFDNAGLFYSLLEERPDENYTVELKFDEGEINYELIPANNEAARMHLIENRKRKYLVKDFADKNLLLELNEDIIQTSEREEVLSHIKKLLTNETEKGYYLYGSFGAGKTHISIALLNRFADEGKTVAHVKMADVLAQMKSNWDVDNSFQKQIFEKMKDADVLLFDDIGAEIVTQWSRNEIFLILEHRMSNNKTTIFTSNIPLKKYYDLLRVKGQDKFQEDTYIGRYIDRIQTLATEIYLPGKNLRK